MIPEPPLMNYEEAAQKLQDMHDALLFDPTATDVKDPIRVAVLLQALGALTQAHGLLLHLAALTPKPSTPRPPPRPLISPTAR